MRRFAALVAAVGLVIGAVQLRAALDDDPDGQKGNSASLVTVICDPAVEAACRAVGGVRVTVEKPGVTAERLASGGRLDADAWVVAAPWVDIATYGPQRHERLPATKPIASSQLSAVVRVGSSAAACTDWTCLAAAGASTAHDKVDTTGGLAGIGALAGGRVGRADFSTNDLDDDTEFDLWLDEVEGSANLPSRGGSVIDLIQTAGGFDVALGLEVDTRGLRANLSAVTPKAGPTIGIVVAGDVDGLPLDELTDSLVDAGWERGSKGRSFNPGALAALRDRVKDLNQ